MDCLLITAGLPGSGKTRWSKDIANANEKVAHVEIDAFMHASEYQHILNSHERFLKIVKDKTQQFQNEDMIILDGLFLSETDIVSTITKLGHLPDKRLEIHVWLENKEICLWNDQNRRDIDSILSINNMTLEKISADSIQKQIKAYQKSILEKSGWYESCFDFDIAIIEHVVEKKPEWILFTETHDIKLDEDGNLVSRPWKTGGTWWSYTGASGEIEPEPWPSTFLELDELIDNLPTPVDYVKRKKIYDTCVKVEHKVISDYYIREEVARFVCDMETLFETLQSLGIPL